MQVKLTREEMMSAAMLGASRRIESRLQGLRQNHQTPGAGWDIDIEGAIAEMAYAKAAGVYFDPTINTFKDPDVAGMQIRSTNYKSGSLIVREGDPLDEVYILVITSIPEVRIAGWILGQDAIQERFLSQKGNSRAPAYFVPQKHLHPMSSHPHFA